jgi:cyclic pyranopterin phosphate synthase
MKDSENFTHIDEQGRAKMVDVSNKKITLRTAKARGYIILNKDIIGKIKDNQLEKGDVLTVAKIAGMNAAKRTGN